MFMKEHESIEAAEQHNLIMKIWFWHSITLRREQLKIIINSTSDV